MRQRATSVELIPEIEETCMDDLAAYCTQKTGLGEEMLCLQDKYTRLFSSHATPPLSYFFFVEIC